MDRACRSFPVLGPSALAQLPRAAKKPSCAVCLLPVLVRAQSAREGSRRDQQGALWCRDRRPKGRGSIAAPPLEGNALEARDQAALSIATPTAIMTGGEGKKQSSVPLASAQGTAMPGCLGQQGP